MKKDIASSKMFIRFGEMIVPTITILFITLPFWLSPFHPAVVAYIVIAFNIFFLHKSLTTAFYATLSYKEIMARKSINFSKKVKAQKESVDIHHIIIIPNYKEPLYKLQATIDSIVENDYPHKHMILLMAFESREEEAKSKAQEIRDRYISHFEDILFSYHVLVEGEAPGKASNQAFAAREVLTPYIDKRGFDDKHVIVTVCDADSRLGSNYFSQLTHTFLHDEERLYHFYWAPILFYNNFWQLPFFVRMQATISSILHLSLLSQGNKLMQISTYSSTLWLIKQVGYWDVDIIPEDWHMFLQAFFTFGKKVRTLPLYTLVSGDAVYSGTMLNTFKNRYEQEKRWAWGVSDIGYAWKKMFTTPHIPFIPKLIKFGHLVETHMLWPVWFFMLTIAPSVPAIINPPFHRTVMGRILPQLSGSILTGATITLLLYIYMGFRLRKQVNVENRFVNLPFLMIQWYLLPVVSFLLSSLPALDAHVRVLLGKKITYKVTEKI